MTPVEIIDFINAHLMCQLATVDGNVPRVRGMMAYRADARGIIFHTGRAKDLAAQLERNPNVEACFFDPGRRVQVRVAGRAEILNDPALRDEIVEARPFLKPVVERFGPDMMVLFRVGECVATVWTMEDNLAPKKYVRL